MSEVLQAHLAVAVDAARKAGALAVSLAEKGNLLISEKHVNDFVTNADKACEDLIIRAIKETFPDEEIFGEESGTHHGTLAGRWVIDPIDGTTNYMHGIPDWTISIAWEIEPFDPLIGVVYVVRQDELFTAVRGEGAHLNGKPISVSRTVDPSKSVIVCVPPHRYHEAADAYFHAEQRIFSACSDIRSFGSCALELAYIAAGRLDGYFERFLCYYDLAAGWAILREAGGVLQFLGEREALRCDLVASNGKIQEWLWETAQ